MPIPQTIRANPLDLQKNIVIGVSIPFNAPGVFNKTYSTKDQIKSNLINLLLTDPGERIMNPFFGAGLKRVLFENINDTNSEAIQDIIITAVNIFVPEVEILDIVVEPNTDQNAVTVTISYRLRISNEADQITIQFQ